MSSSQQRRGLIAIEPFPTEGLERRNERVIVWQQGVRETEFVELPSPARPQLREARILFQEIRSIQIAASVEENLSRAAKPVDEIAAKLIRRENTGIER